MPLGTRLWRRPARENMLTSTGDLEDFRLLVERKRSWPPSPRCRVRYRAGPAPLGRGRPGCIQNVLNNLERTAVNNTALKDSKPPAA